MTRATVFLVLTLLTALPALAAVPIAPTVVNVAVPWGSWLGDALNYLSPVLQDLAYAAVTLLAGSAGVFGRTLINQFVTRQVIEHAVDGAIARAEDVTKGQVVSLPVAGGLLRDAERYVVAVAPSVAKRLGDYLIPRLQAQLTKSGVSTEGALQPLPSPNK